ncbi:MAG TPA: alpha/beta hydrolase [Kofleriaceae bacterium]|nr:alpha/beta hydrolase [Kofleriaceae bacterium]
MTDRPGAPGPLTPTSTQTISELYTETFRPAGTPKGVVLVTHGYAEHCGRYREVAHVIVNAGWAVRTYDVRGHGRSPGDRGYIDRFTTFLADFAAMQAAARDLVGPSDPMVVLGHSHGSLITLRALCDDRPAKADAAIVASPFLALKLKVPAAQIWLAKAASKLTPRLAQPNALRVEDLTSDPQRQAERTADKLCFDIATARWFTEASAAQDYVLDHADRITVPTTWLITADDPITDPARSRLVASRVAGADVHDFAGMKHEAFNEVERGKVFAELTRALAKVRT